MGIRRVLVSGVLLSAAGLAAMAPLALAEAGEVKISASRSTTVARAEGGPDWDPRNAKRIVPGRDVDVVVSCTAPKPDVRSEVADFPPLRPMGGGSNQSLTTGTVRAGTKPGVYKITLTCGDKKATDTITVGADTPESVPSKPKPTSAPATSTSAQVGVKPKGGAETGGGAGDSASLVVPILFTTAGVALAGGICVMAWRHRRADEHS